MRKSLFVVALYLLAPCPALAQENSIPPADQEYSFPDHELEGGRHTSDGEILRVRNGGSRHSLIRPRRHFVAELSTSIERL